MQEARSISRPGMPVSDALAWISEARPIALELWETLRRQARLKQIEGVRPASLELLPDQARPDPRRRADPDEPPRRRRRRRRLLGSRGRRPGSPDHALRRARRRRQLHDRAPAPRHGEAVVPQRWHPRLATPARKPDLDRLVRSEGARRRAAGPHARGSGRASRRGRGTLSGQARSLDERRGLPAAADPRSDHRRTAPGADRRCRARDPPAQRSRHQPRFPGCESARRCAPRASRIPRLRRTVGAAPLRAPPAPRKCG